MTRHGIMNDIKGIQQAYETSPNRDGTNPPNAESVSAYQTAANETQSSYFTSTAKQATTSALGIFISKQRAASPPLPPS